MSNDLEDAAAALDALAAGRTPDPVAVLAAAQKLEGFCAREQADRDVMDAAAGLRTIATGGTLELDAAGRQRARALAAHLRQLAGPKPT